MVSNISIFDCLTEERLSQSPEWLEKSRLPLHDVLPAPTLPYWGLHWLVAVRMNWNLWGLSKLRCAAFYLYLRFQAQVLGALCITAPPLPHPGLVTVPTAANRSAQQPPHSENVKTPLPSTRLSFSFPIYHRNPPTLSSSTCSSPSNSSPITSLSFIEALRHVYP